MAKYRVMAIDFSFLALREIKARHLAQLFMELPEDASIIAISRLDNKAIFRLFIESKEFSLIEEGSEPSLIDACFIKKEDGGVSAKLRYPIKQGESFMQELKSL